MAETTDLERDPWQIADDIEQLLEEYAPEALEHEAIHDDEDWVNRRMLALQFTLQEMDQIRGQYQRQLDRLRLEIEKLEARRNGQLDSEHRTVVKLTSQLESYHAARIADADRRGLTRKPTMVRMPHGDLRSQGGGNVAIEIEKGQEAEVVAWLQANGMGDAVTIKPAVASPDKRKLQGLVETSDDGEVIGIVNTDGERLPHVTYRRRDRAFWVELADGRSSKDWLKPPHD